MTNVIRQVLFLTVCFVVAHAAETKPAWGEEAFDSAFIDAALDPSFSRNAHGIVVGGNRIESAGTSDGQHTGISYAHITAASDLWNNEHNEVLGGIRYTSRIFDRQIALPGGVTMPDRVDAASAALIYKHITNGDWSLTQSVRYTHFYSEGLSSPDKIDLVGLAAISREPGYAWLYGYIWNQTDYLYNKPTPLIEYVIAADEEFSFMIGFPVLSATYRPHPDWTLNLNWSIGDVPSATAVYHVNDMNYMKLSYGSHDWVYHLTDPVQTHVTYTARLLALDWMHSFPVFRRIAVVNATIGREMDRRLGADTKLSMGDATILGLNLSFGF